MFSQSEQKETIILSLGMLGDLNHMATGGEFIKLGGQTGKLLEGAKLGPDEVKNALSSILPVDIKLQAGAISPAEFRAAVLEILKLKNVTDVEFDKAWNAMHGDVKKISERLEELKKQNPSYNIVLVSVTSQIHVKYIFDTLQANMELNEEKAINPTLLQGIPLYVSYLSAAFKAKPINKSLVEEVFNQRQLQANKTIIIINPESNTYTDVKKRDEANAASVKQWAEGLGIRVIERQNKVSVLDTITNFRNLQNANEIKSETAATLTN